MQQLLLYMRFLLMIVLFTSITGCMVGPNFHIPGAPYIQRYTRSPLPKKTVRTPQAGKAGKAQTYVLGKDICADWWRLFHSPQLNELMQRGIDHSPTLAAAYAALRQAQENFNVQVGNALLPAVNGVGGIQRQLFPGSSIGGDVPSSIFNEFTANVSVSYNLDIFGASRRQLEALGAQVDFQQFELIAAYLTLTSNIATTAVNIASLQAQIKATRELLRAQVEQLNIIKTQYRLGGVSYENVLTQQTLVEQTRATIPNLQKNLATNRHALSALVGAFPNQPLPEFKLKMLNLPAKLPVSLSSNLVRQRPDVRASEALMHAAMAQVGVATANLFPQINLTGNYGWGAPSAATLFSSITNTWSMAAQLTQPIFHGGALLAQRRAAIAAYQQTCAQYRQAVLQAFQNVADSLRAIETDARALRALTAAEISARNNLALTTKQFRLGGVSYLNLLTAQQQYQQTVLSSIQAQATRYTDTVALFQSLGGGWWNKRWCVKECFYEA